MAREQERLPNGELLVQTPQGLVPRSLIHRVPEGMRLQLEPNGEIIAVNDKGDRHEFPQPSEAALAWLKKKEGASA